jgi:hypothetical protein
LILYPGSGISHAGIFLVTMPTPFAMRFLLLTLLIPTIGSSMLHAETRVWKSKDGDQSFSGEYISHDEKQVTIRKSDSRLFKLDLARLNESDKAWLAAKMQPPVKNEEPKPARGDVFDTLTFGDSYKTVMGKLQTSKMVEASMDEIYLGRTGLNGTYRTRKKIGGFHYDLYFGWAEDGSLDEVFLQTPSLSLESYEGPLQASWGKLIELLTILHGNPIQAGSFPSADALKEGLFLPSHLWQLKDGGSALLGTSMQSKKFMIVVRFTQKRIDPVTR